MNDFFGIPDTEFIRGYVPMSKEEVRVITISKLRLCKDDNVLDVGAGTGSISIEIARILKEGIVYAVEKNSEGIELIKRNCENFKISNLNIIEGNAPQVLENIKDIDKIVVGGSGGNLTGIIKWAGENLNKKGVIVINSITFDTLTDSRKYLEENKFNNIEIIQVSINKFEEIGRTLMLKAQNPVFIISAVKEN